MRLGLGIALVALLAGGGTLALLVMARDREADRRPPALQRVVSSTLAAAAPRRGGGGAGTSAPSSVQPVATSSEISFESVPSGALVTSEGREVGVTPFKLQVAAGGTALSFIIHKAGFRDASVAVVPERSRVVRMTLRAAPQLGPPAEKLPPVRTTR